ncbi:type II toxin-antitoxin system VapC family toxin [Sulfolobaceae archaeon RB850M]
MIDGSILSTLVLKGTGWEKLVNIVPNSLTLDIAYREALNVITLAVKKKVVNEEVALKLYEALNELMKSTKLINSSSYIEEAFKNSLKYKISIYDSLYITVSAEKKARLATLDPKLKKVAEKIGILTFP